MGVIKGYDHELTEGEYLALSNKKSPLLATIRREVYTIFKAYKKRCFTRSETDSADRCEKTHHTIPVYGNGYAYNIGGVTGPHLLLSLSSLGLLILDTQHEYGTTRYQGINCRKLTSSRRLGKRYQSEGFNIGVTCAKY